MTQPDTKGAQERVLANSRPGGNGCWVWTLYVDANRYGRCKFNGKASKAHRVSYEAFNGPIPQGLQVDHLCRNRSCVNPAHLELVTSRENTLRGAGLAAACAKQTHCKKGHEFTESNTIRIVRDRGTERRCRTCANDRKRDYRS